MRHIIFLNGIWPNDLSYLNTRFTRAISCYQLKHWLSHFGFKSQVIDYCQILTADDVMELLEQFISPETFAIGVSTSFWPFGKTVPPVLQETIRRIREKWPQIKIISGGARKTHSPEFFDKHFVGESENQLLTWCQEQTGKTALSAFNKKFDITSLNHRFDETDAILEDEALPLELGRGCIFKCKFCAHQNLGKPKFTYQRHFDLIVDEIKYNHDMFGTTKYMLLDDTVNEDLDKIKNLSTLSQRLGFNIEWTGYLRADLVWARPGSSEMLQESGMCSCFFGVETFHPGAGKSIDKGWGSKHGKDYLPKLYHDLWQKKINIHVNMIAGLPTETMESLENSLEWARQNPIGFYRFLPLALYVDRDDTFASSEFTRNYEKYGYKNLDNQTGYWELDTMNCREATEFCAKSWAVLYPNNRISSWDVFNGTNLGFTVGDVMTWDYNRFRQAALERGPDFKTRYIAKLKSINT